MCLSSQSRVNPQKGVNGMINQVIDLGEVKNDVYRTNVEKSCEYTITSN